MEKVLSVSGLLILASLLPSILAAPRPEAPVANYIANFYDPHPISTYGAHPFHINSHSSEAADDVHVGNSRRGTSHEDHDDYSYSQPRYRPRGHHSYGNSNKYPKYSGEHHDEHDAQDSPSYSSPSKSGYNPFKAGRDYSPFQGYAPEGWFNTMQGGYDDYGYNYDRAGSNSPAYKGPPRKTSYNGYGSTGPSSMEHDHPSVYSFGAGAPEFVSYTEDDEPKHTFSTLKSGSRRPSNGYGEDPYFTFGPKKKASAKPVSSLFDILSAVTGESSKSSSGSYRHGGGQGIGNKYSGPKASSSNKYSSSGRPKSSSRPSPSYYDKGNKKSASPITVDPSSRHHSLYSSSPSSFEDYHNNSNSIEYMPTNYQTRSKSRSKISKGVTPSYNYSKFSTLAPYKASASRFDSHEYNRKYNWENDGWTITHR